MSRWDKGQSAPSSPRWTSVALRFCPFTRDSTLQIFDCMEAAGHLPVSLRICYF